MSPVRGLGGAGLLLVVLAACHTPKAIEPPAAVGTLSSADEAFLSAVVGEPPRSGSQADQHDRSASVDLIRLEGTDRWMMATAQAELRVPLAAQHFDCAVGARFAARERPALTQVMAQLLARTEMWTSALARQHPRGRPIADPTRNPCQVVDDATRRSSTSWPSGGAAAGAAYGELFAHLAPDRAEAARRIGAELGHSRAICAINWPSDVEAGQRLGVAAFEALSEQPEFRVQLDAARAEIEAARAEGLSSPACAAERRLFPMPDAG